MAFPAFGTKTDMGQGLMVESTDGAGAVCFHVYQELYTTVVDGVKPGDPIKEIKLTKTQVDALIAAIQST